MTEDHVEYVRRDLLFRVCQLVKSLIHLLGNDVILNRDWNFHEHVIFCFCLDIERELLHAQVDAPGDLINVWKLEVHSCGRNPLKLSHALHDNCGCSLHMKEAAQDGPQRDESDYSVEH